MNTVLQGDNTLIGSFETLGCATRAQYALLSDGIPDEAIELRTLEHESGSITGQFVSGNGIPSSNDADSSVDTASYVKDLKRSHYRGNVLLIVHLPEGARSSAARGRIQGIIDIHRQ